MAVQAERQSSLAQADALDELLDYNPNLDDIFGDENSASKLDSNKTQSKGGSKGGASGELGIDEEITVLNKRQPVAKLDDARLLSELGIPKVRKIAKKRKNFRGKGYEFSDISKVLAMYQLWLDELYPRAKFSDGLAIIEKLGHSKRIQLMRKHWIEEGRPNINLEEESGNTAVQSIDTTAGDVNRGSSENDAVSLPRKEDDTGSLISTAESERPAAPVEDELDALLSEQVSATPPTEGFIAKLPVRQDDFEDDMEAMAEFEDMW